MTGGHPLDADNDLSPPPSRDQSPSPSSYPDEDEMVAATTSRQRPMSMPPHMHSFRGFSPIPDNVVRASSPFGRRYLKPINGIQTKGFARSAQRRSSVVTLGSIERLQNFYAAKELKVNKTGMLGFRKSATPLVEEPEGMNDEDDDDDADLDQLPTPQAPPPSWMDLDVETDLDVLLKECFDDIQHTLTQWAMVTGPRQHPSSSSHGSSTSSNEEEDKGFQILPLLDSVTKMINSVKNYMHQRHDLSDTAQNKVRHAALDLLNALKTLETRFRKDGENDEHGEYAYHSSEFGMLEQERKAIHAYLSTVEKYAFNPPHHIGSPPAVFSPEIRALMLKTAVHHHQEEEGEENQNASSGGGVPVWLQRSTFQNDPQGRYHALLQDNNIETTEDEQSTTCLPDPHEDPDGFLASLADGIVLCNVYNNIVKRSRRPFGFINKVHKDTKRTYRAIENLRFFAAACSFRFELTFEGFEPSEIARKTEKGLTALDKALTAFCECVIRELREYVDTASKQRSLPAKPPMHEDVADYLDKKLTLDDDDGDNGDDHQQ